MSPYTITVAASNARADRSLVSVDTAVGAYGNHREARENRKTCDNQGRVAHD